MDGQARPPHAQISLKNMDDTTNTEMIRLSEINSRLATELDDIRAVLLHGADESLWPPGMTLAQAVAKLKDAAERGGGRVPLQIKMLKTVLPDPSCNVKPGTILREGQIYKAWPNSYGEVFGRCCNGEKLGVYYDEFEVVSWHDDQQPNNILPPPPKSKE